MRSTWCSAVGLSLAFLALAAACSGGDSTVGAGDACGEVEQLFEPGGNTHVIDPAAARFQHHPPSSGPHFSGNPPRSGVHDDPVAEALQVTALEFGAVVVSYERGLDEDAREPLEALADDRDDVLVTPAAAPIDDAATVALTAWEHRMLCSEVSIAAAEDFIAEFAGRGPGEVVDTTSTTADAATGHRDR